MIFKLILQYYTWHIVTQYRHLFTMVGVPGLLTFEMQGTKTAKASLRRLVWLMFSMAFFAQPLQAAEKTQLEIVEGLLAGKYSIVMRHALAPGTGDPQDFQLNDCDTQRNLSTQGRKQAEAIGEFLRRVGVKKPAVFSSQWCRCKDTATLMGFASVTELAIINSFFRDFQKRDSQTKSVRRWLMLQTSSKSQSRHFPLILVTHQVNISALTSVYPSSGEMIIVELSDTGKLSVVARWLADV